MRKTAILLFSILTLLLIVSCSSEGVVDDAFTVTVTFNGNGAASGSMEPQRTGRGVETRLEANAYEWPCHNFTGWNTASDGSGTAYTGGQSISVKENITLYAQWELDPIILTSNLRFWTDGNCYTLDSNVSISYRIDVTGNVTLILPDGYTLTALRGINVPEGSSLTIDGEGTGSLFCETIGGSAGIGGGYGGNCGNVTINGGKVYSTGQSGAAGIGGGEGGNGGNVTINGGTVEASSPYGYAGIGRGYSGTSDGTLTLGEGVVMKVRDNDSQTWSDYSSPTRMRYMKTV